MEEGGQWLEEGGQWFKEGGQWFKEGGQWFEEGGKWFKEGGQWFEERGQWGFIFDKMECDVKKKKIPKYERGFIYLFVFTLFSVAVKL